MNPQFTIQRISVDGPHSYVIASILSPQNFSVSQGSLLGSVRLKPSLFEPNKDTYTFQIEDLKEAQKLRVGEIVDLTS